MKSQINLLRSEFKPHFIWICGSHFIALVVFACLLSGLGFGATQYLHSAKAKEVDAVNALIAAEQKNIDELTVALTSRVTDPLLQSKLSNFIALTQSRSQLLDKIQSLSELKQRSFSNLFESFSQAHSNELWLTRFLVTPSELTIQGQISRPNALPKWISQLSNTAFFSGQEFDNTSVNREQDVLIFTLNSSTKAATLSTLVSIGEVVDER